MFANNDYAKVWDVKPSENGKFLNVRISTSRRKEDESYEQDFGGFVRFVGKAKDLGIKNGDRIQLLSVGVTNSYVKEKDTTYTNFICFDAKMAESNNSGGEASVPTADNDGFVAPDGIEDELPFN